MQNVKIFLIVVLSVIGKCVLAQDPATIQKYIDTYKDLAIEEMQRTGVPASIKLAQGIHETLAGTSDLVLSSNNHFGIKCKDTWTGESVKHDDDLKNECFRKYSSAADSYRDHSDFLKNSPRYSSLFTIDPTDYKDWAYGLKKAGYATNPKYPQIIIKLIEDYHLQDYTLIAMGKIKPKEEQVLAKTDVTLPPKQTAASSTPVFINQKDNNTNKQAAVMPDIRQQQKVVEQKKYYPEGEFKINETRVIYAKKGTPFLAIAQQFNISLAWLFEFNDMNETEAVEKDQLIYLQRKRKTGDNEFHVVKQGESLHDIAQSEAIRLESLEEYNMLQPDQEPAVGEQLSLRTKSGAKPRLALKTNYSIDDAMNTVATNSYNTNSTTAIKNFQTTSQPVKETANFITYTVQPKETIWAIAQKFKVKVDDLVKWNQLNGNDVKAGQQLKINK